MHNMAKLVTLLLQPSRFNSNYFLLAWNCQHLVLFQSYFLLLKQNFINLSNEQKNLLLKMIRLCLTGNRWTAKPCMELGGFFPE